MDTTFQPSGPARFKLDPTGPTSAAPTPLHSMATPADGVAATSGLLSLHNPLTWFAVLAAVTLGLASVSTAVRVGPGSASFKVGK